MPETTPLVAADSGEDVANGGFRNLRRKRSVSSKGWRPAGHGRAAEDVVVGKADIELANVDDADAGGPATIGKGDRREENRQLLSPRSGDEEKLKLGVTGDGVGHHGRDTGGYFWQSRGSDVGEVEDVADDDEGGSGREGRRFWRNRRRARTVCWWECRVPAKLLGEKRTRTIVFVYAFFSVRDWCGASLAVFDFPTARFCFMSKVKVVVLELYTPLDSRKQSRGCAPDFIACVLLVTIQPQSNRVRRDRVASRKPFWSVWLLLGSLCSISPPPQRVMGVKNCWLVKSQGTNAVPPTLTHRPPSTSLAVHLFETAVHLNGVSRGVSSLGSEHGGKRRVGLDHKADRRGSSSRSSSRSRVEASVEPAIPFLIPPLLCCISSKSCVVRSRSTRWQVLAFSQAASPTTA